MNHREEYEARLARVNGAVALEKTDRVPCIPLIQTFPYLRRGHTMAQALYDADLAGEDNLQYHLDFQPDMAVDYMATMAGEGPMLEKLSPTFLRWAGQPGSGVDENSIHQFIERTYLEDEEYPEILTDFSGWVLRKLMPRLYPAAECFARLNPPALASGKVRLGMRQFADPRIAEAFALFAEAAGQYAELGKKTAAHQKRLIEAGFPLYLGGAVSTAFDALSDCLRGTLEIMMDLILRPDEVLEAVEQFHRRAVESVRFQLSRPGEGRFIFIPLHKGFDGFMSPAQYEQFYWPTLKRLVEEIVALGGTPLVYTEGKYDSRLETISDLPAGKVLIHIERADMREVRRIFGGRHCFSGGFPSEILRTCTPDGVRDEVKRFLDTVAVDGGYIFDLDDTLDDVSDACVAAMFETVAEYGRY